MSRALAAGIGGKSHGSEARTRHLRQRKDGLYQASISMGLDGDGRPLSTDGHTVRPLPMLKRVLNAKWRRSNAENTSVPIR